MLLDNRARGTASVVVIPTTEWDKMRAAKLRSELANKIPEGVKEDKAVIVEPKPIVPIEGSNLIQFSNHTDSNLAGCSSIGAIEIRHRGTMDDAIISLS